MRREINKNIAIEEGRQSSTFVDRVESSIFFFNDCWGLHQNELGGIVACTRWERKYSKVFFSSTRSLLPDDGGSRPVAFAC
jgi:hypothetical protein